MSVTGSNTAHINAVSMPTIYYTMVLVDGEPHRVMRDGTLRHPSDPDSAALDGAGAPLTVESALAAGSKVSESFSDVSWRTPFGADIQHPRGHGEFLDVLAEVSPDVNTIRLDFNAATLKNTNALQKFKDFSQEAADRGYELIIQFSDGGMAGRQTPDEDLYPSRTTDPSAQMAELGQGWAEVMEWFEAPEQADILEAVYGWEIVNEPMAYPRNTAAGEVYARDIDLIVNDLGIDWHDKKILVGGLGASSRFEFVDVDAIRDAVGPDLVWSFHMYPDWGNAKTADFDHSAFLDRIERTLSPVFGDDIILTETHMGRTDSDGNGITDILDYGGTGGDTTNFNGARAAEWFAENGIGYTYWPPAARGSSFLISAGKGNYNVLLPQLAMAGNAYSLEEGAGLPKEDGREIFAERTPERILTGFAQARGGTGDDTIHGDRDITNLLYAGSGDDTILGGDQGDWIFAQAGNDVIMAGAGNDTLFGGRGDDTIYGGDGDDWIEDGSGRNHLYGGAGNDTILAGSGSHVWLGEGSDQLVVMGTEPENGPTVLHDLTREDRIDLSAWTNGRMDSVTIRVEHVTVEGQDEHVLLTIPGQEAFSLLLTPASAEGFNGAASFSDSRHPIVIDDLRASDPTKIYDPETGLVEDVAPPVVDPVTPDPSTPPIDAGGGEVPGPAPGPTPNPLPGPGTGPTTPPEDDDTEPQPGPGGGDDNGTSPPVRPRPSDPKEDKDEDEEPNRKSGDLVDCFVATAAYGDRMHPDVVALRAFRDIHLARYRAGRLFIAFYWSVGPRLAAMTSPASPHGRFARWCLSKLVKTLRGANLTG